MDYRTVPLTNHHDKISFSCGKLSLDQYLKIQASQDVKKQVSTCFVLADRKNNVIGYYTLSAASIPHHFITEAFHKRIPRYNDIPVILLGRLALDKNHHGKGLGNILIADALKRAYAATLSIGALAVVVDPLDDEAENYYSHYGFIKLPASRRMFMPMKTIGSLFDN
jgi:predicted N-acetyltransferase YhbS